MNNEAFKSKLVTDLELLQSLLAPPPCQGGLLERIAGLEQARRRLHAQLPVKVSSARQQQALDILRNQACMEMFCRRRCEAIKQSELSQAEKQRLLDQLRDRFLAARERQQQGWPRLDSEEAAALPLLLMRQTLEDDIDRQLTELRQQFYSAEIA